MTISADNITWRIGRALIVDQVSLEAHPGKVLGIVGPNGSGKSSLLRLLAGLRKASEGRVMLDGQDIRRIKRKVVARRIAFVEQQVATDLSVTVKEVVQLGRIPHRSPLSPWSPDDESIVAAALERVGMSDRKQRLWQTLSGGERQRVQIARALAQAPSELLLDEPTNHLDIQHQLDLLKLIVNLGTTSVIALHDLNHAAMFCDGILVMNRGSVVARGTPREILTEELLRDIFKVAARVETSPYHGHPHIHFIA